MLYFGIGGAQDLPRALKTYKKAADFGLKEAQHSYAVMRFNGEGGEKDPSEAQEYFEKAANQGVIESVIALQWIKEQSSQKNIEEVASINLDEDLEIVLPSLQEETLSESLPEEEITIEKVDITVSEKPKEAVSSSASGVPKIEIAIMGEVNESKDQEETNRLIEKHQQEIVELRKKKLAQKRAADLTKQSLKMKRKDYEETKIPSVKKVQVNTKKSNVRRETLEFVKTIFGIGTQSINTYSVHYARRAFADLGCKVSNKKGENSTKLEFVLDNKWVMKFKFHNPHGQGEDLYDDLKPYMKRFLESINKTPDKLII